MSDPLRTTDINETTSSIDSDAERDAKIESLLLSGLDQYFAADYAQAIDIWTRALFLDRSHARARAYIARARSARAEGQREAEGLLHNGVAAIERGEIEAARKMQNAAVKSGGAHDEAQAVVKSSGRIHAATAARAAPTTQRARLPFRPRAVAATRHRSGCVRMFVVMVFATAAVAAVAIVSWDQLREWIPALNT